MELELVQADADRLNEIMAWRMRVIREVFAPVRESSLPALEQANRQYYEKHLADHSHLCFFLMDQDDQQIKGCSGICLWQEMPSPDNPSGQCAYFMNIFIDPRFRRQHMAAWMIRQMTELCRKRQITKIYLESTDQAKAMYARCGFIPLENYMIFAGENR